MIAAAQGKYWTMRGAFVSFALLGRSGDQPWLRARPANEGRVVARCLEPTKHVHLPEVTTTTEDAGGALAAAGAAGAESEKRGRVRQSRTRYAST